MSKFKSVDYILIKYGFVVSKQGANVGGYPVLTFQKKLAFFGMVLGMFMAILDVQIVASSLSVIAAGLSASTEELSWIQTSYLIAEVIVIPISGFIARCLSIRIAYFIGTLGFTIMSILCSLAWNIESMIIFRALQGLFGGCMIPTVFSTMYLLFPPNKRPNLTILIGLVVTVAPTIGPTLGGYITEFFSWHFMFLVNVIPGIVVCTLVYVYADFDKPNLDLLKNFDRVGIISLAFSLGVFQYLLEEGNNKGWFEDSKILILSILVFLSFIIFLVHELRCDNPIVDLSTFGNKNFTLGCIYSFITGIGLFGAVYLLPLFLFSVAGFNTIQIGTTMMVTGIAQFCAAPLVGKLIGRVDFRVMLAFGFFLFSVSCYYNSLLTVDSKFEAFILPQIFRGMSLMLCFIPTNNLTLGTIPKDKIQNASSLFNLTRNLGGAVGLAVISNLLTAKTRTISSYLRENITISSPAAAEQLASISNMYYDKMPNSSNMGYIVMNNMIEKNSMVIAINDIFIILALFFLGCILTLPIISNVELNKNDNPAH